MSLKLFSIHRGLETEKSVISNNSYAFSFESLYIKSPCKLIWIIKIMIVAFNAKWFNKNQELEFQGSSHFLPWMEIGYLMALLRATTTN